MKASVVDRGSDRRGVMPTRFRPGAAAGVATALAGAALGLSAGSASGTHWGGVTTYSPVGQSNGIDVFLSPAHHRGPNASQVISDKAGCFGYVEEENNRSSRHARLPHTALCECKFMWVYLTHIDKRVSL